METALGVLDLDLPDDSGKYELRDTGQLGAFDEVVLVPHASTSSCHRIITLHSSHAASLVYHLTLPFTCLLPYSPPPCNPPTLFYDSYLS